MIGKLERRRGRPFLEHGGKSNARYSRPVIEVTDWARDILTRSHRAASRFNPGTTIRLARAGHEVQAQLAEAPEADDQPIALGEVTVYVEAGLEGLVDVEEPHDRLVLRPTGSTPNIRGEH
jgi:hypothetical protein